MRLKSAATLRGSPVSMFAISAQAVEITTGARSQGHPADNVVMNNTTEAAKG